MLKLYNSLTKKIEEFKPIKKGSVGIYSCGPTVYWNQHIGHMYAYVQWDVLVRYLRYKGYKVKWVMNITDVGHLTGDDDTGIDKMEKGAKREGKTPEKIAKKYTEQFLDSLELLNISRPDELPHATRYIKEQIALAKKIERRGFAYETKKGLVFDTGKFGDYGKFANLRLDKLKKRQDLVDDPDKKKPWDFFLWVKDLKHLMKWDSPWGEGYPGWHIECTTMSTSLLGDKFDIHTGGNEHKNVHHTNEIAQGHAAFGGQTANFWLHNAWLTGKGGTKMSKSLGNFLTVQELVEDGVDPLALRYLFMGSHYRKGLAFTRSSLQSAETALDNLRQLIIAVRSSTRSTLSDEKLGKVKTFREEFENAMNNDLNTPQALAVLWKVLKSNIPNRDKADLVLSFDKVLGLGLSDIKDRKNLPIPKEVKDMLAFRNKLRGEGKYEEADLIRKKISRKGFVIKDTKDGSKLIRYSR